VLFYLNQAEETDDKLIQVVSEISPVQAASTAVLHFGNLHAEKFNFRVPRVKRLAENPIDDNMF